MAPDSSEQSKSNQVVEHFFRHESGKILAHLTRSFGTSNLEHIEDAVQEALYRAMKTWPYSGVPQNASGWVMRVARNKLIDILRKKGVGIPSLDEVEHDPAHTDEELENVSHTAKFRDDQLGLFFACCHESLSWDSQVILTLKLLCGFSKGEIARALLKKEDAVAKAFTRAKARLQAGEQHLEVPVGAQLQARLQVVLRVLYLLFNEGYKASSGQDLVRKDLCFEAIRLTQMLLDHPLCATSEAHALLALMLFQASRLEARMSPEGTLIPLEEQDRSLWKQDLIQLAIGNLNKSAAGASVSEYQLQASIAACYSTTARFEDLDWSLILHLYDLQLELRHSPIVALNRLVSFSRVHGPDAALKEMTPLEIDPILQRHHLFFAIRADLLRQLGQSKRAEGDLRKALELTNNTSEQDFLRHKIHSLVAEK